MSLDQLIHQVGQLLGQAGIDEHTLLIFALGVICGMLIMRGGTIRRAVGAARRYRRGIL